MTSEHTLKEQLNADLREALRSGDETRKTTIRGLLASVHNAEIQSRESLDDAAITGVVGREIKQRRDSIEEYKKGNRPDLVAKEQAEIDVLSVYLPPQLSRDEIVAAARAVIERVGAKGPADKGKVMGPIMAELRGKAEGAEINAVVTELLNA
jgi:uncharacterized protein YqeY